ncbi:hypothetical protein D1164_11005 [Mariniphaga sediminis]|uniref:Uncharacterized protein n=1 Tax=Mariniphaga sediminis TaxID=1628158 RepID=A0A399D0J2_9BACT|nr:hypothetical protein [Mariniphaga sediminis]RIH65107.1 hypothetical protein D1164_11005 [Mariniphaga sediminis]
MENWFPDIFADVKNFSPIEREYIYVSELNTHELQSGINSTRDYQTLLINPELIEHIKPDEINQTSDSSVRPAYDENYEYEGESTVFVTRVEGLDKVKPLVISWESANNITFQIDPYFLLTYGLTPRLTETNINWDDLSKPQMDVVQSIPKSVYDFPIYSKSYVKIRKDYLQDYLMLKKKTLIQVYCETRILPLNTELEGLLGQNRFFEKTTKFSHFRINKISENEIFTEVTGFRQIKLGNNIPFSKWDRKEKAHYWSGYKDKITRLNAKHWDYVYVSDEVLGKYEQDENYSVCPETGGVSYKNQWSVTRCNRIGRNHIEIELFKLYEGTPNEVISYWNKYQVDKSKIDETKENIAERSKKLVFSYLRFGELLATILNDNFGLKLSSQDLIKINRKDLNYYAWYNNASIKPITHHLAHTLSKDAFLVRQKKLHLFLVENLVEKELRNILKNIIRVDLDNFKKSPSEQFRSIKLLNLILNYIRISNETGLDLKNDSGEINSRLVNDYEEMELMKLLEALNILRQLDSHQEGSNSVQKLIKAFKSLGIDSNEITGNYLTACEKIYDKLYIGLRNTSNSLNEK